MPLQDPGRGSNIASPFLSDVVADSPRLGGLRFHDDSHNPPWVDAYPSTSTVELINP